MSSPRLERLKAVMQDYVDRERIAGVGTLILRGGRLVHFETYGKMDRERDLPMRKDSYGRGLTADRHKAAGIQGWYLSDQKDPIGVVMERLAAIPFEAQPGEQHIYGYNTDILGAVVEKASGLTLDQFFRRRIFEPLKMVDSGFFLPQEKRDRLATVYSISDGTLVRAPDGAAPTSSDTSSIRTSSWWPCSTPSSSRRAGWTSRTSSAPSSTRPSPDPSPTPDQRHAADVSEQGSGTGDRLWSSESPSVVLAGRCPGEGPQMSRAAACGRSGRRSDPERVAPDGRPPRPAAGGDRGLRDDSGRTPG
ncbi:MAG: serine hydrolase [Acidobacteriota bacterium]